MGRPSTGEGLAGELIEGNGASSGLPAGTALDIGCGTGDSSIYLARHGWQVTGVDFVSAALAKAPKKADGQRVAIDFVQAGSHGCRYAVGRDPATTVLAARRHNYALAWTS